MSTKDIVLTVVLPAIVMALFVLMARLTGMTDDRRAWRERASLLGVVCAFIIGTRFVVGNWPGFAPKSADDWLIWFAASAGIASIAAAAAIRGKAWPLAGALLSVVFGALVVVLPLKTAMLTQVDGVQLRACIGVLIALLVAAPMIATGQSALRITHAGPALALLGATAVGAPGLFFSSSVKLAQIAGVLAVCSGVLSVAGLAFKKWEISRGAAGTIAGLNATLWAAAYFYASAPKGAAILGAISPCAAALSFIPGLQKRPKLCMALQFVLAAAIAAAGTALAKEAMPKDDDPYG